MSTPAPAPAPAPADMRERQHQHQPQPVYRQIAPLAVLSFLQAASFGLLGPMLPIVMTEYFARIYTQGVPIECGKTPHAPACVYGSKEAAWLSSIFSAVGCGFLFFLSPLLGQASDVYGRKPFIVMSQVARVGVPFSIMYFMQPTGSIMPYFVLRLVDSGFGTAGVTSASIADIVVPEQRATAFALSFACFSVGFCLASFVAPYCTRTASLQISATLFVTRVIWSVVVLPETLPPRTLNRRKSHWHIENPLRSMTILCRSRLFVSLTCLIALTSFVQMGLWQIRNFYLNSILGFDEKAVAHLMLLHGLASIFSQTVLLQPLMAVFREKGVIVIAFMGCILESVGFGLTAFYPKQWIVFALTAPGCLADLSFAAISSLKSVNCSEKEQGRLQGAIYGARAIFEATGPVLFSSLYAAMKEGSVWSRALPYLVATAVYVIGIGVTISLPVPKTLPAPLKVVVKPVPSSAPASRPPSRKFAPMLSPSYAMSPGTGPSAVSMLYETTDEEDEQPVQYASDSDFDDMDALARPLLSDLAATTGEYEDV